MQWSKDEEEPPNETFLGWDMNEFEGATMINQEIDALDSKIPKKSDLTDKVQESKTGMEKPQPHVPMKKIEKKPLRMLRRNSNSVSRSSSNPYNLNFATTDMSVEGKISKKVAPKNEYNSGDFFV